MKPPRNIREVQVLTGRIAGLSRFISQASEKSLPFFRALKKGTRFEWDEEADKAFEDLKQFLTNPPLLTKTESGDE
ncbi:hypothetical protein, partial [Clostridioides difficile]|uniref:hypothetical protein n=1 Tax=Clostridioides difficile TaxID=1496 RepID=UPI0021142AFC|nr:hypothetical protein [Clostridioides difficile]